MIDLTELQKILIEFKFDRINEDLSSPSVCRNIIYQLDDDLCIIVDDRGCEWIGNLEEFDNYLPQALQDIS